MNEKITEKNSPKQVRAGSLSCRFYHSSSLMFAECYYVPFHWKVPDVISRPKIYARTRREKEDETSSPPR